MNGICRVVSPFFSVTFGDWKPELHRLRRLHTGCTARQGRKAPQEEDLASIDTVLRFYSTGQNTRNAGAAQSRGACRVTGAIRPRGAVPIATTPRLPAHPLCHLAERERHGDRTSLNPGKAWPSRLHLSVDGSTHPWAQIRVAAGEAFL